MCSVYLLGGCPGLLLLPILEEVWFDTIAIVVVVEPLPISAITIAKKRAKLIENSASFISILKVIYLRCRYYYEIPYYSSY